MNQQLDRYTSILSHTLMRLCFLSFFFSLLLPASLIVPFSTLSLRMDTPAPSASPTLKSPSLYLPPCPTRFKMHTNYTHGVQNVTGGVGGRILVVGDIHGCVDELDRLIRQEDIRPGRDMVIAAGDLVGKGPQSKQVIQFIRENSKQTQTEERRREMGAHELTPTNSHRHTHLLSARCLFRVDYLAIAGNHDLYLLRCALLAGRLDGKSYGDNSDIVSWTPEEVARSDIDSELYARTYYARMNGFESVAKRTAEHYRIAESLSDEELYWLATLPLSIDVDPYNWTIVHAGLVPGIDRTLQHPYHCTTMRNLVRMEDGSYQPSDTLKVGEAWSMHLDQEERRAEASNANARITPPPSTTATATSSTADLTQPPSPPRPRSVVFGHDAQRGFQYPNSFRVGLDGGCCNGKYLIGLLLPSERVVHVRSSAVYSIPRGAVDVARAPPEPSGIRLTPQLCCQPAIPRANSEDAQGTTVKRTPQP